jgi:hypothetical protein
VGIQPIERARPCAHLRVRSGLVHEQHLDHVRYNGDHSTQIPLWIAIIAHGTNSVWIMAAVVILPRPLRPWLRVPKTVRQGTQIRQCGAAPGVNTRIAKRGTKSRHSALSSHGQIYQMQYTCLLEQLSKIHPSGLIHPYHVPSRNHNNHPVITGALHQLMKHLLEHLAVGPLVRLAVDGDGLVPRPLVIGKLLVLGLLGVELGELVALVVRGDVESGKGLLAADDEHALDDGVVGLAVHGSTAEDVLAGGLKTGKEAACDMLEKC